MRTGRGRALTVAVMLTVGACGSSPEPTGDPAPTTATPSETETAPAAQDIFTGVEPLSPVEPGTYFIDADVDPSTSLRAVFEIPAEGWSSWLGAVRFGPDDGHVSVSITTVVNLVTDGCADHLAADPPVGPSVDDLATALTQLEPFEVTTPPEDVRIYGYRGRHLEWTVPDIAFDRCDAGDVRSWIAPIDVDEPGDAFYGYTGPGYTEEFWILDVEGTRLMIAAGRSVNAPADALAELRDILASIRIEP